jgi:hypothetical protein
VQTIFVPRPPKILICPVTGQRLIDPQSIPQFGLVAEEVEKVNPNLIVRDKEAKPCRK